MFSLISTIRSKTSNPGSPEQIESPKTEKSTVSPPVKLRNLLTDEFADVARLSPFIVSGTQNYKQKFYLC
jgi:hypothetical protein